MKRRADHPCYVISVAAELAGIHPQTLRAYERVGLVNPARAPGGARRYSDADLARLTRIAELTRMGLPHLGIKLVLDLEDELHRLRAARSAASRTSRTSRGGAVAASDANPSRTDAVRSTRRINQ